MASDPIAGHGALLAYEQTPGSGIFKVVSQLTGDVNPGGLSRPVTVITPHQANMDQKVTGTPVRANVDCECNFVFDDDTHDHLTGLKGMLLNHTKTGWMFTGPTGDPDDYTLFSGEVVNFTEHNPVREGVRSANISIAPTGPMIVAGVTFA